MTEPTTAPSWTFDARPDTGTTSIRVGVWLFLASEAMLFASLVSADVLLRTGAPQWPDVAAGLSLPLLMVMTALLALVSMTLKPRLAWAASAGAVFLGIGLFEYGNVLAYGLHPSVHVAYASWWVLTGLHWLHVGGGVVALVWHGVTARHLPARHSAERLHALRLYWGFVDSVWLVILALLFI